ncbi:hypothetical protein V6N12_027047 [Hibiscus sabdariffa]|uniref:protein-serine/threonine phosphatase n=1 Tax=Hibiscus sabdariffa TaxID=183260 RepID=A0ABR2DTJ4_9ROSI
MTSKPPSVSLQPDEEKPHEKPVLSCTLKRKRPPTIEIPNVLQEIQANSLKGKKKVMEDVHMIVSCLHGNSNKAFFGVYDGHGGKNAADFVAQNLHDNLFEMLKDCK